MKKTNFTKLILFYLLLLLFNCNKNEYQPIIISSKPLLKKEISISKELRKNWYKLDVYLDTIPGISLNRAYDSLLIEKKGKEVIVAIIDTEIDINHNDLKGKIWKNNNEIPNNNLDDDKNGYVDDINGWNFIGNQKNENMSPLRLPY